MIDYICNGEEIYCKFFVMICFEVNLEGLFIDLVNMVVRLIYVCGMIDIFEDLVILLDVVKIGCMVLIKGVFIFCDV